jgi:hypothetical protein
MKFTHIFILLFTVVTISVFSCKTNDETPDADPNSTGNLTVHIDNVAGSQDFALNTEYTNASSEKYAVSKLWYYISNIRLKKSDGTEYVVPQDSSYFLVKEDVAASQELELSKVPQADYVGITFTIGVDSLRNTADVSKRTGALDIAGAGASMYWSWNSGYIFFKMEGTSPQAPADANGNHPFLFHVGGYGGYSSKTINNIKTKTLTFGSDKATVRSNIAPEVHLLFDIAKVMNGSPNVSLSSNAVVMGGTFSSTIATNYVNGFVYDHTHNDPK